MLCDNCRMNNSDPSLSLTQQTAAEALTRTSTTSPKDTEWSSTSSSGQTIQQPRGNNDLIYIKE